MGTLPGIAEDPQDALVSFSREDGLLTVRITVDADDPGTWEARTHDEDEDRVLVLKSAETDESAAVFTFAPAGDGWDDVDISVNYTEAATGVNGTMSFLNIPGTDDYFAVDATDSPLPMLSVQNVVDMSLAEGAELLLVTGDMNAETVDAAVLAEAVADDDAFVDCRTVVRVQDGVITEIRHYADVPIPEMMADVLSLVPEV